MLSQTSCLFSDWPHLLATVGFTITAMMCKEQGLTVIGVCIVYEICIVQKVRCDVFISCTAFTYFYMLLSKTSPRGGGGGALIYAVLVNKIINLLTGFRISVPTTDCYCAPMWLLLFVDYHPVH